MSAPEVGSFAQITKAVVQKGVLTVWTDLPLGTPATLEIDWPNFRVVVTPDQGEVQRVGPDGILRRGVSAPPIGTSANVRKAFLRGRTMRIWTDLPEGTAVDIENLGENWMRIFVTVDQGDVLRIGAKGMLRIPVVTVVPGSELLH